MVKLERMNKEALKSLDWTKEDQEFANACENELGYSAISKQNVDSYSTSILLEAFNKLGITPLDDKLVGKYKEYKTQWRSHSPRSFWTMIVFLIVIPIISVLLAIFLDSALYLLILIAGLPVAIFCGNTMDLNRLAWYESALSSFIGKVPEFALQTALDLKRELHGKVSYQFKVVELRQVFSSLRLDPFLVITAGGRDWYLEVWDEPDFKQKRQL